jgi:hypothetical protein
MTMRHTDISVTAFIVNESRARLPAVSHDTHARLWVDEQTRSLWEELACDV